MLISKCFVLGVSDVDTIAVCGNGLIPNPDIGNVPVCRITVEPGLNVPFQIDAAGICVDGIIPAVNRPAVQRQTDAFGIALGKADPIADVKRRFGGFLRGRFGGLRLFCRFGCFRCRWCRWFCFGRCSRNSCFRLAFGCIGFWGRFAGLCRRRSAAFTLCRNRFGLRVPFRYAGRGLCCGFGLLLCCALGLLNLRFLCCLRRFRLAGNFFTFQRRNRGRLFGDWRGVAAPRGQAQKTDEKKNCDFGFHTLHSLRQHSTR